MPITGAAEFHRTRIRPSETTVTPFASSRARSSAKCDLMKSSTAERPDAPGRNKTTRRVRSRVPDQARPSPCRASALRPSRSAAATMTGRSRQVLVEDRVGVLPSPTQVRDEVDRQVLIDLEFHRACSGFGSALRALIRQHTPGCVDVQPQGGVARSRISEVLARCPLPVLSTITQRQGIRGARAHGCHQKWRGRCP